MDAAIWLVPYTALLLLAAGYDVVQLRIPNAIPLALAMAFLLKAVVVGPEHGWLSHLGGFALTLLLGFILSAFGIVGGGDAKLLAAVALWLGLAPLPLFLLIMSLLGGLLAVLVLMMRNWGPFLLAWLPITWARYIPPCLMPGAPIPYGVPIALAALLTPMLMPIP